MANIEKLHQPSGALRHNYRLNEHSKNTTIDNTRSELNNNWPPSYEEAFERFNQILDSVERPKRKDAVLMCSACIQAPNDLHQEDMNKFFSACVKSLCHQVGGENIASYSIHYDEATPHIHIDYVPIIQENGVERVCCKKQMNRDFLKQFHQTLSKDIDKELGYHVSILRDDGREHNYVSMDELKRQGGDFYKRQVEQYQQEVDDIKKENDNYLEALKVEAYLKGAPLEKEAIDQLNENQKDELDWIYTRQIVPLLVDEKRLDWDNIDNFRIPTNEEYERGRE